MKLRAALMALVFAAVASAASNDLNVYFIDVEGGQSTLFVTPSGESVLIDTGWADPNDRDAKRILAAAKAAGVKQIDYLLITHYHADHIGGAPAVAAGIPIRHWIDHGNTVDHSPAGQKLYDDYVKALGATGHTVATPGYKLPVKGLDWTIVAAATKIIEKPLTGAGNPNPGCADFKKRRAFGAGDENAQSDASYIAFGNFKMADLGDLLWNEEEDLMCPNARVPPVDVYVVSHHGMNMSGSSTLVNALHPKVAIMDNGAHKGGTAEAWDVLHASPGMMDIWQAHFAVDAGVDHNSPENVIANMQENPDEGYYLRLVAHKDGHFEVTNPRNGYMKKY